MRPEDMVVCDLDGYLVDGPPGGMQCREVKMHSCVYKARPDVMSVVHCHPRFLIVMSVLQATLVPMCQEGIQLVRNPLPVYPHVKTVWRTRRARRSRRRSAIAAPSSCRATARRRPAAASTSR